MKSEPVELSDAEDVAPFEENPFPHENSGPELTEEKFSGDQNPSSAAEQSKWEENDTEVFNQVCRLPRVPYC